MSYDTMKVVRNGVEEIVGVSRYECPPLGGPMRAIPELMDNEELVEIVGGPPHIFKVKDPAPSRLSLDYTYHPDRGYGPW